MHREQSAKREKLTKKIEYMNIIEWKSQLFPGKKKFFSGIYWKVAKTPYIKQNQCYFKKNQLDESQNRG